MSRQKISTLLEPALYRQLKIEAARQDRQMSEIVGEALAHYFRERGGSVRRHGVVADSWGSLRAEPADVMRILAEEDGLLDARGD